ncbi:MAG: hypothetical protein K2I21_07220, partial [Acetatifactor sp.]|nr:hypothetical protein [Acetatifactor sp.]
MKVYRRRRTIRKIAFLVAAALIFVSVPSTSYATSSKRQEIADKENEKGELESQRDANQQELDGLRGEQR